MTMKKKIAKLVAEKANAIENGTIHVWVDNQKSISLTLNSQEYRDNNHTLVASLVITNEGHPYTQAAILRQLEFLGV
jgi:hypothetical protein